MTTKQKMLVGVGVLALAAFVYARTRKRTTSPLADPKIGISVECVSGDCSGAPATSSWLTGDAPDSFLYLEPWDA